jgi:hypothetical protein
MEKVFRMALCSILYLAASGAWAETTDTYVGLEFFGSTRIDRQQLEKLISLKGDASAARVSAAQARLEKYFERAHLKANIQVVSAGADELALVVDVPDPLSSVVTRRLNSPHHVRLASEMPLVLLTEIHNRLNQLEQEGRPAREQWREGYKFYSDEPVNQMIGEIQKFLPSVRLELLQMVDSDPDPLRRAQAIELLEWGPEPSDTASSMLAALDDADRQVRSECAKYLYARLNLLADDFPFDALTEGLARMLDRPAHQDRSNALHCLVKFCPLHKDVVPLAKSLSERRVAQLAKESILPTIKQPAETLLTLYAASARFASPQGKEPQSTDSGL